LDKGVLFMDNETTEPRKTFHQQLDELYLSLLGMANRVLELIEETRSSFVHLDIEAADRVISEDDEVDDFRYRVEEGGVELLARQAPVAIDLRNIVVIMRLAQHLERVADLCVNISKAIKNLEGYRLSPWIRENMDEMFQNSERMIALAMEAFKKRDLDLVDELNRMDEKVDRINRSFFTGFSKESPEEMELIIRVVMISRFLERIADHAVDIGENVRFLVTGKQLHE
jgi:phosphate transport system protein